MRDCENLENFKKKLLNHGITEDEIDLEDYRGLTSRELSDLVDFFIRNKEASCKE